MLKQKFIVLQLSFAGQLTGLTPNYTTSIENEILKTCDFIEDAEAFVHEPANKGKALIVFPVFEMINSRLLHLLTYNKHKMEKIHIAEIAHQIVRVYDVANGNVNSPDWANLPDADKQQCLKQVEFYLDNPEVTPDQVHKVWLQKKAVEGWGHGPIFDLQHKQDPLFVEYISLPVSQKLKYHVFQQVVKILKQFLQVLPTFEKEVVAPDVVSKGNMPAPDLLTLAKNKEQLDEKTPQNQQMADKIPEPGALSIPAPTAGSFSQSPNQPEPGALSIPAPTRDENSEISTQNPAETPKRDAII